MSLTRRPGPSRRTRVREFLWAADGDRQRDREDRLVTEEPLEIRCTWPGVPARRVAVTMRTPGHDFELAAGLLRSEGVLVSASQLHTVAYCTDHTLPEQQFNVVTVRLTGPPAREPAVRYDGPAAATSACGVCGVQSIDDVLDRLPPDRVTADPVEGPGSPVVKAAVLRRLPARLRAAQRVFDSTGGLHAAGLFDPDGELVVVREDVGRHNAVDKVVGHQLLDPVTAGAARDGVLLVSGRVGFEIVHKAAASGARVLAAVGAPSSLAVDLAERTGMCLVGFLRDDRFVTYTHPAALA